MVMIMMKYNCLLSKCVVFSRRQGSYHTAVTTRRLGFGRLTFRQRLPIPLSIGSYAEIKKKCILLHFQAGLVLSQISICGLVLFSRLLPCAYKSILSPVRKLGHCTHENKCVRDRAISEDDKCSCYYIVCR